MDWDEDLDNMPESISLDDWLSSRYQGLEGAKEIEEIERVFRKQEKRFGKNLRNYMKIRGVTEYQLAERTGLSLDTVRVFMGGQFRPQLTTVRVFASILKCRENELWPRSYREKDN